MRPEVLFKYLKINALRPAQKFEQELRFGRACATITEEYGDNATPCAQRVRGGGERARAPIEPAANLLRTIGKRQEAGRGVR